MKTILSQIHAFDASHLSLAQIFDAEKEISNEIYARSAFGDVSLSDSHILRNMLDGIVKNKLSAFENVLVQPKKKDDQSIAEIFIQKITIPAKNTALSLLNTPFYNMRVTECDI